MSAVALIKIAGAVSTCRSINYDVRTIGARIRSVKVSRRSLLQYPTDDITLEIRLGSLPAHHQFNTVFFSKLQYSNESK